MPFFLICLLLLGIADNAAAQPAPDLPRPIIFVNPVGPPVASEGIRVSWSYEGTGVYYFVIEREEPYDCWTREEFQGYIDDTSVQRGRTYRYRVCAVYEVTRACDVQGDQGWVSALVPTPQGNPPTTPPPPPPPPPPPQPLPLPLPVLRVEASGISLMHLTWVNLLNNTQLNLLTDMSWYRDGSAFAQDRGFRASDIEDAVPPNSGPYRYQLCIANAVDRQCSEESIAGPPPITPTAPNNVQVSREFLPGGRTPDGIVLRPRHVVRVTWGSAPTIPGVFLTVERNDTRITRNPDPNSPVPFIQQSFWSEVERLTVNIRNRPFPFSAIVNDLSVSVDPSLRVGKTYRVCSVVPILGEAGKVCSQTASLP